jgi:protoporphyrinogen/coproporphyrinogen III oxidase
VIAIVGAGVSGLTLARELAARGQEFVVLEATGRAGGVIRSGVVDGHLLEWGPQRIRLSRDMRGLVDSLGLADDLVIAPSGLELFVYHSGSLRRVPFSIRELLTSDIISLPAKLRLLAEPLTAPARDDESIAAFFTRKLGRSAYQHIAGPLYGGLYASDPADMIVGTSLRQTLRDFGAEKSLLLRFMQRGSAPAMPAASFTRGMSTLTDALRAGLREHVRLQTPVTSIRRVRDTLQVATSHGTIDARHVVLTGDAPSSAALLADVSPELANAAAPLTYNPLAIVHLHAETALRGFGYQVSLAEKLVTRGVTWNDSLFARAGVYTAYLGGAANPWVAQESNARLAEIAATEFETVTGYRATAISVAHARMPAWDRSWNGLADISPPEGIHIHSNWRARPGLPGRLAMSRRIAEELSS